MDYSKQTSQSFYKIKQRLNKSIKYSYFMEMLGKKFQILDYYKRTQQKKKNYLQLPKSCIFATQSTINLMGWNIFNLW